MTPEREQEIRTLAAGLAASARHKKIGGVLAELLQELDDARADASEWEDRYDDALSQVGGTLA